MESSRKTYSSIDQILSALAEFQRVAEEMREIVLANLVMIGEIPAPTFEEERRIEFLCNRFNECELQNPSTDEIGNGLGILPGCGEEEKNILVVAHADTVYGSEVNHTLTVHADRIAGPGVGDNSLGLAVLATLPTLLQRLDIRLESNLFLMGAVQSLGRGNLAGLHFFLENSQKPFRAGICVEGFQLGRLSCASIGMLRGEFTCRVPEETDWTRFGAAGAIIIMNDVINRLTSIPMPRQPMTSIVLGMIEGGKSYNTIARHARLRFEVRSESVEMVETIRQEIERIVAEVAYTREAELSFARVAQRTPGGIDSTHPLVTQTRRILNVLDIPPRISPSTSELSAFLDQNIPAVTLGITQGERASESEESILIEPISRGLAQILGLLLAIDGGYCDGN